ncbi:MAG: hypothetical protein BRD46_06140 [Bacteroidetes bacterium QS_8_68_15]|nr:MAG: hypothetical protein BRD46_06140 [Bacteroidetes bacterium QS_8_68_15]
MRTNRGRRRTPPPCVPRPLPATPGPPRADGTRRACSRPCAASTREAPPSPSPTAGPTIRRRSRRHSCVRPSQRACPTRRTESASVAAAYRRAARERPNLTVIGGARVRRIDIEDGRAVGVSYVEDGLRWSAEAERAVVLCGGPVATPHLLMRSGIGPPQHLRDRGVPVERARPGIGRGLRDPLAVRLTAHADGAAPPFADGGPVPDASAFVRARSASPAPDLQLAFEQQGAPECDGGGTPFAVRCTLLAPQSRGRVRLRPDTGPPDGPVKPPVLDPQALTAPADGAALIEGLRRARRVLRRPPFTRRGPVEVHPGPARTTDDELRAHIRLHAERAGLPSGTCRMGPSGDEGAVVDDALRVHGFAGRLRVADASMLPATVRLTGPLPLLLLAERAAALVQR